MVVLRSLLFFVHSLHAGYLAVWACTSLHQRRARAPLQHFARSPMHNLRPCMQHRWRARLQHLVGNLFDVRSVAQAVQAQLAYCTTQLCSLSPGSTCTTCRGVHGMFAVMPDV